MPADVLPGSHYGPHLITFILHQYHHNHVTQPLLLEELHDYGIDISAGQLSRLLTEDKEAFHREKADVLAAGLQTAEYVGADDTGARHRGHNGFCTHVGNDRFAYFQSTNGNGLWAGSFRVPRGSVGKAAVTFRLWHGKKSVSTFKRFQVVRARKR